MNRNNPTRNRIKGYGILSAGILCFALGCFINNTTSQRTAAYALCAAGIIICIISTVWMIRKVRCPHCGKLLHLKLFYSNRTCPYCGKDTDI
jgi:hypothetical protein